MVFYRFFGAIWQGFGQGFYKKIGGIPTKFYKIKIWVYEYKLIVLQGLNIKKLTMKQTYQQAQALKDWVRPCVFLVYHPNIKKVWPSQALGYLAKYGILKRKIISRQTYISESDTLAKYAEFFGPN